MQQFGAHLEPEIGLIGKFLDAIFFLIIDIQYICEVEFVWLFLVLEVALLCLY